MTWRVRRVSRTLWPSIRGTTWLSASRGSTVGGRGAGQRLDTSARRAVLIEPSVTSDAFHSLAWLRLDRAMSAVREPD